MLEKASSIADSVTGFAYGLCQWATGSELTPTDRANHSSQGKRNSDLCLAPTTKVQKRARSTHI